MIDTLFSLFLVAFLTSSTLVVVTQAQLVLPTVVGMMADSHCGEAGYCVTAWLQPSTKVVTYFLVIPKGAPDGPVGWWGFAQSHGDDMQGANMAICWATADGSALPISHRSASGEVEPQTSLAIDSPNFIVNANWTSTQQGLTIWSWNMALPAWSPQNAVQHIFATNPVGPSSNDVNAHLMKHDKHEHGILLDLTKPYDGSMPAGIPANHPIGGAPVSAPLDGGPKAQVPASLNVTNVGTPLPANSSASTHSSSVSSPSQSKNPSSTLQPLFTALLALVMAALVILLA